MKTSALLPLVLVSSVAALGGKPDSVAFSPAEHPAPPQIRTDGGTTMTSARIVPVFFANDPLQSAVSGFVSRLGGSAYWTATTAEYGIGPAAGTPPVVVTDTPPTSVDSNATIAWLTSELTTPNPAFPVPDSSTIYAIYYPAGTTVLDLLNPLAPLVGCKDIAGYHAPVPLPSGATPQVVVVPRCAPSGGLSAADLVTATTSQEAIDSVTDPQIDYFAWNDPDFAGSGWSFGGALEIADACFGQPHGRFHSDELSATVQRAWSNAAAEAGHDPCVPAPAGPYFNAAPVLDDGTEVFDELTSPYQYSSFALGVSLAPGEETTIELRLFSDGPSPPWTLSAAEIPSADPYGLLDFAFDGDQGANGDVRHLRIHMRQPPSGAAFSGNTQFEIVSTLGDRQNAWRVTVGD